MSHSKRNTSLAFFTSYERSLLKSSWGSQSTRLTRESFLPFGSCKLCLMPAQDPVACPHGDVFCRECAMNNLLAQREEIKRLDKDMQKQRKKEAEKESQLDDEATQRAIKEFELVQMGLEKKLGKDGARRIVGRESGTITVEENDSTSQRGQKRKFQADELLKLAEQDQKKTKGILDEERRNAAKSTLPSFWVPSQTPTGAENSNASLKPQKLTPVCPGSSEDAIHHYSLKALTKMNFTEENDAATGDRIRSCPSCRKKLSNATKAMLAVPCGHVLCKPCVSKFMTPDLKPDVHNPDAEYGVMRCHVCEADLTTPVASKGKEKNKDKPNKGLVEIQSEGTGFAGGGKSTVEKRGIAFQC
ncbi:hypothetical protein K402DRAFT_355479 [Aulographum hederae CBS 113979]|uniref:RING-type domain-containing protein n=1 Tax=Aulographum hederae CBS 113979 TaxID=1176131 RepID=A0A6G1H0A6_9PEZI|nr:hypothetical protein K402DRAFT_355479 [Aulographum hederae CBS 113979]